MPQPEKMMNPLEARIGYKFRNTLLMAEALTHPSISLERKNYPFDNQRLEFLGDAVIQLVVTEHLFRIFPHFSEGKLTKLRTRLVSRTALSEFARSMNIGAYLMMGRGEVSNRGSERASTLADAFESITGAIYMDSGYEAAKKFILREMRDIFVEISGNFDEKNPKGALQEILQAVVPESPAYEMSELDPTPHSKVFCCMVKWNGLVLGEGQGGSKKQAQIAAAAAALERRSWEKKTKKTTSQKV